MARERNVGVVQGLRTRGRSTDCLASTPHQWIGYRHLRNYTHPGLVSRRATSVNLSMLSTGPGGSRSLSFFCALFHGINGLRITILDLWPKLLEYQREAIWVEWVVFSRFMRLAVIVILGTRWEVEMRTKSRTLPLNKRGMNFETFMWLFTRLSALAIMYLFMLVAIVGALVMGARNQMNLADVLRWAFTPNVSHVQSTNVPDLEPWATPFWKYGCQSIRPDRGGTWTAWRAQRIGRLLCSAQVDAALFRILIAILTPILIAIGIYVIWTS